MSKTKNKFIFSTLIAICGTLIGAISASLMWFAKMNAINLDFGGSVLSQYFDSGDGSEEDPFVITRPKHWENLVWLHNNVSTFYQAINNGSGDATSEKGYYFQVGKLNPDIGDGVYYVYDYNDNGMINTSSAPLSSRTLNLKGSEKLIPIGSCTKPFMGEIISDGITISGFDVLGFEDLNNNLTQDAGEKGFNDVGIFGYVGRNSNIRNLYFDEFKIHLSNAEADRPNGDTVVHATTYHDKNKDGDSDTIYVGYIAGHIHYSTTLSGVYINNCTIDGGSPSLSGFGYFGVVENEDGNLKPTPLEEITETKQSGDGNSFGGSVDMMGVYNRLAEIFTTANSMGTSKYVSNEIIVKNNLDDSSFIHSQEKTNVSAWSGSISYKYYETEMGGVFNFPSDNDTTGSSNSNIYQCLYGESSHYTKTVTTYTYIDDWYDCFTISVGENYLNNRYYTDIQNVTNKDIAAGWNFDGSNHLYTKVLDETYYLNASNYSLTLSTTANTVWAQSGEGELYTVINGVNCYLDYDSSWHLSPYKDRYLISDGNSNYLGGSLSGVTNSTSENTATRWIFDNPSGNTSIGYFDISDNNVHYLTNTNESLGFSTSKQTWIKDGSYYYVSYGGIKHYIVFENGQWALRPENGVNISDGSGHYLTATNSAISNSNSLTNGTLWHYSSATGDTQIFHIYNGTKYYLTVNDGTLSISTNASTWHRNGSALYYTQNNKDYYLTYDGSWRVITLEYYTIHDSTSTNYLVANGTNTFSNTTVSANATHFYFSDTSGTNPTGTINYANNGTVYYLYIDTNTATNGVLQSSTSNSTTWANDGNSIYYNNGNYTYYLEYNNGWSIRTYTNGHYITDGTNYMTLNGTTIGNTTDRNQATIFIFSNGNGGSTPSGTITAAGTTNRLRINSNALSAASNATTSWSNNGSNLYNGSNYLICKDGAWSITSSVSGSGYYMSYNGYYLNCDASSGSLSTTTTASTLWEGTPLSTAEQGTIKAVGTSYYLNITTNSSATLSAKSGSGSSWYNANNVIYVRYLTRSYPIRFTNNAFSGTRVSTNPPTSSQGCAFTFTADSYDYTGTSQTGVPTNSISQTITTKSYIGAPSLTNTEYNAVKNTSVSAPITIDYNTTFTNTQFQNCQKTIESNVKSGNPTYFPLRVDQDENTGQYADGYAASDKNTGYLISGANCENSSSTADTQKKWGDIRISGWAISNISGSYSSNSFSTVYTVDDTDNRGTRALTDSETADADYQHALEEYGKTLQGSSKVYGVHFMDAAISKEHTIRANKVKILGQTYTNYELPEDSIDFNVYQRGKISFFAGEYFDNNDAFFSFHRIFRDSNNDITEIKEISEIYWHATRHDKANYIYKFTDNTYTNADGTYTSAVSLDGSYSATAVFKTEWITNPSGLNTNSKRLYYFAIPCNKGEYALGSVSGKNGAYLSYLDIAANGGDTILQNIKTTDTVSTFPVDFRNASDTTTHSILQLGVEMPAVANPEDLQITVSFDNSSATCEGTSYSNGIYKIYVTNKTGYDLEISVLVVDDDDDLYNDYNYAYQIYYTNNDHIETIINGQAFNDDETALIDVDYWKRLAIFVIPTSGEGAESSYE